MNQILSLPEELLSGRSQAGEAELAPAVRVWTSGGELPHHAYVLKSIRALMPAGEKLSVLDAGCGTGYVAAQIAAWGHRVTGIDLSPSGIALALSTNRRVRYEVRAVLDDLSDLMPVGGWDVIVSSELIEHLPRPLAFLRNMNRCLRPGGVLILTTPYHGYLKNLGLSLLGAWDRHHGALDEDGHIKFFSQRTLSRALQACGFDVPVFRNAGRAPFLWKSMVCRSMKPVTNAN